MLRRTSQLLLGFLTFIRATAIGGVFVLAPIVVLLVIVGYAVTGAYHVVSPLVAYLPYQSVAGISLSLVIGSTGLVAVCFLTGLLANTALATWFVKSIESAILTNLPGYSLMKSMGEGLVGLPNRDGRSAVLVQWEHSTQIGFLMDRLADGRGVVFVPGVPSPWTGQLHIVPSDRYETLDISVREALEALQRMGIGTARLLEKSAATPAAIPASRE